jgi:hypothetical protein
VEVNAQMGKFILSSSYMRSLLRTTITSKQNYTILLILKHVVFLTFYFGSTFLFISTTAHFMIIAYVIYCMTKLLLSINVIVKNWNYHFIE